MNFNEKLQKKWSEGKFLCIGLDSDQHKLPAGVLFDSTVSAAVLEFNRAIIGQTHDIVAAYKPNFAFYEDLGADGIFCLGETIKYIREVDSTIPIILDFKRGDIGNTNLGSVNLAFNEWDVDAVTVSPYMGKESLSPFLDNRDKGIIVICKTSNPGSGEFQDLETPEGLVYEVVAKRVSRQWNVNGNCALVVGATYPAELAKVRDISGNIMILIPGIGKQGGDLEGSIAAGLNARENGILINSSREILFASNDDDFAQKARAKALETDTKIREAMAKVKIQRQAEVMAIMENAGAMVANSHIVYTSGKHGREYINKDAVYPNGKQISFLCGKIAACFADESINVVVGPATGGIALSQWVAAHLSSPDHQVLSVYAEKESDHFVIKRGYENLIPSARVLVVEDILNTGGSVGKVIDAVRGLGGLVVGLGALCNRGGVKAEQFGLKEIFALTNLDMEAWDEQDCPLCKESILINTQVGKGREYLAAKSK